MHHEPFKIDKKLKHSKSVLIVKPIHETNTPIHAV